MSDFKRALFVQSIIIVSILFVAGGLIGFFVFHTKRNLAALQGVREPVLRSNQDIQSLAVLRGESVRGLPLLEKLRATLPSRDRIFAFPKEVEKLANAKNVSVSFAFGSENPGSQSAPPSVHFTLNVGGRREDIINFLKSLESETYLLQVTEVDLNGNETAVGRIGADVFFKK